MGEESTEQTTEETTTETTNETTSAWNDGISEDFRGDPGLKDFSNVSDLAKSYLSLTRMMNGRIKIPTDDSGPDDVKEFHSKLTEVPTVLRIPEDDDEQGRNELFAKLGRPETHEQYSYKSENLPEGLAEDKEMSEWFKKSAHEQGMPDKAVSAILGQWDEMISTQHAAKMQAMETAETDMKKEWGNDYGRRMGAARQIVKEHGSDELAELLESSGMGNNPYMTKFLSDMALKTMEDSAIDGGMTEASETPAEMNENLVILQSNPAYLNAKDPMHKMIVDKAMKLQEKIMAFV